MFDAQKKSAYLFIKFLRFQYHSLGRSISYFLAFFFYIKVRYQCSISVLGDCTKLPEGVDSKGQGGQVWRVETPLIFTFLPAHPGTITWEHLAPEISGASRSPAYNYSAWGSTSRLLLEG